MKKIKLIALLLMLNLLAVTLVFAQNCPSNIGFEAGNLTGWKMYTGTVASTNGSNVMTLVENNFASADRHAIMTSKTAKDAYGNFPVLAPNGSNFSVKLGNTGTGRGAEGISYIINIPANKPNFVLTYQYAVVFQDPKHQPIEQPKFTAKVLDVSTNQYINCASFEYVATSSLPGFKASPLGGNVIYKDWTPVTINLSGYQGKQLILEFKNADCTAGGHFGYAYVDVNENCENLISGSEQCIGALETNLAGPSGYSSYKWFSADRSVNYGEGEAINIKPALPTGTVVQLDLVPFEGFGCPNTVSTTIAEITFNLNLLTIDNLCKGDVADITSTKYILNKTSIAKYTYFADAELKNPVPDPTQITTSGIYYIVGTLASGCTSVQQTQLIFYEFLGLDILSTVNSCVGNTVDLTSSEVQKAVPAGLTVSYFGNSTLTLALSTPESIKFSGDYYIKYQSQYCSTVKKVTVIINPLPILKITDPTPVCDLNAVDLTATSITAGSDNGLTFTYFSDAALTQSIINPKAVTMTGDYYVLAKTIYGCASSSKIHVEIYSLPILQVKNPEVVCAPLTVNLTDPLLFEGSTDAVTYAYFDANGVELTNPKAITTSGTYLVTITNANNCTATKQVQVTVNLQPILKITQPKKVFIAQSINLTNPEIIEGSSGYSKVEYWEDELMTVRVQDPKAVTYAGKYYISLISNSGCISIAPVDVITVPYPKIVVPTAFTPLKATNNLLFPFFEGIQKLTSFKVYNKWGNLVFETNSMDPKDGWNGTFQNLIQPFETYSWFAEGTNMLGYKYTTKGKTVLIP